MKKKEDTNITKIKTLKIEEKFSRIKDLYWFLLKNMDFVEEELNIKIQKNLNYRSSCIMAKEEITERNILFFASKSEFPENLGQLVALGGAFDADIVVFFTPKSCKIHLDSLNWLQRISNEDTLFIEGEAIF